MSLYRRPVLLLAVLLMFLFILPAASMGSPGKLEKPRVIMVLVNRVTLEDMLDKDLANIQELIRRGGLGITIINTADDLWDDDTYATIAAGRPAMGAGSAGRAYNVDETMDNNRADAIYQRNTGLPVADSEVVHLALPRLLKNNSSAGEQAVCALGNAVRSAGLSTAVFGNSDREPDNDVRLNAILAMDGRGQVTYGNVGKTLLKPDPMAPYGIRTDYEKLWSEMQPTLSSASLIVAETGDNGRVNSYSSLMTDEVALRERQHALQGVDNFVGQLLPLVNKQTMVMLVTPLPHDKAIQGGYRMAPVIMAGGSITAGSLLSSNTTRHKALLANYDLAPTVLEHLGIPRPGTMIGLPVVAQTVANQRGEVLDEYKNLYNLHNARQPFMAFFIRYQEAVLLAFLVALYLKSRIFYARLRPFLLSLCAAPAAMMLVPLAGTFPLAKSVLLVAATTAALTAFLTLIQGTMFRLLAVTAISYLLIAVDLTTGARLAKSSLMSYDALFGGRFYGIGNEYMGVLIGCTIFLVVGLSQVLPGKRKFINATSGTLLLFTIYILAAPWLGTNAGGTLAAMTGFLVLMLKMMGNRINFKTTLWLTGGLFLGLGLLVALNTFVMPGSETHIGRASSRLLSGDLFAIYQTIAGKLNANLYLVMISRWTFLLLLMLTCTVVLLYLQKQSLQGLGLRYPELKKGIPAIITALVAAFVFNDTGLIAATIMIIYLVVPLCLFYIDEFIANFPETRQMKDQVVGPASR